MAVLMRSFWKETSPPDIVLMTTYIFVFEGASQGDKIEHGSDGREGMRIGGYLVRAGE